MSTVELLPVAIPVDDEQDAEVVRLYKDGLTIPEIAKRFGLSRTETTASLDRALPRIDGPFKRRQVALAALRLDELQRVFHQRAIEGDTEAAHVSVRASCELRAWLGIGGSNFDPVQLLAVADQTQTGTPAAYLAVLERLGKLPPSEPETETESSS
jgi:hypothetical protein